MSTTNKPEVLEALRSITGYEQVRRVAGTTPDGAVRYEEGYEAGPEGATFYNEKGQHCHVPAHRIEQAMAPAEPRGKAAK